MQLPDHGVCYRALQSRDARFDGLMFVGVSTTGVFCRPVCPARTPNYQNCRFFGSAAAARDAGFRPCRRCRPETAPELTSWQGGSYVVSRALALIADGALDGGHATYGVRRLAERVGLGERQLRRLFLQHLGAPPASVARTRRLLFAQRLIQDTGMSMTEVAMASGFGSLRRFNETFQKFIHCAPSTLRRNPPPCGERAGVTLRLRYRPPYDWEAMLGFLRARAIAGVEVVRDGRYLRTIDLDGDVGSIEVSHDPDRASLAVHILVPSVRILPAIVHRVHELFDLGTDIDMINAHLSADPMLGPLVARRPGLRVPGAWDGFELAVRAVLGQQVSVAAARRLAGQLVAAHGRTVPLPWRLDAGLTHVFPTPEVLAAGPIGLGMPAARLRTISAVAGAAIGDPDLFRPSGDIQGRVERLVSLPGIGAWTAQYIAMRAHRAPDAFPETDVGLLRGASELSRARVSSSALRTRAESWRPWRAYAAQHLWSADLSGAAPVPARENDGVLHA